MADFGSANDYRRGRDMGLQGTLAVGDYNQKLRDKLDKEKADRASRYFSFFGEQLASRFGEDSEQVASFAAAGGLPTVETVFSLYDTPGEVAQSLNFAGAPLALTPPGGERRTISRVEPTSDGKYDVYLEVGGKEFPMTRSGVRVKDGGEPIGPVTADEFNLMLSRSFDEILGRGDGAGVGPRKRMFGNMETTQTDTYESIRRIGDDDPLAGQPGYGRGASALAGMGREELEGYIQKENANIFAQQQAEGEYAASVAEREQQIEDTPISDPVADPTLTGDDLFNSVAEQNWRKRDENQIGGYISFIGDAFVSEAGIMRSQRGAFEAGEDWTSDMKRTGMMWVGRNPEAVDAVFDSRAGPYGIPLDKMKTMQDKQRTKFTNNAVLEAEAAAMYRLDKGGTDFVSLEELDAVAERMKGPMESRNKEAGTYVEADPVYGNTHSRGDVEKAIEFWKNRDDIAIKLLSKQPFYNDEYKRLGPVQFALEYGDDNEFQKNFRTKAENTQIQRDIINLARKNNFKVNTGEFDQDDLDFWAANNELSPEADAETARILDKLMDRNSGNVDTSKLTTKASKILTQVAYLGLPTDIREDALQGAWWKDNLESGNLYGTWATDVATTMDVNTQQLNEQATRASIYTANRRAQGQAPTYGTDDRKRIRNIRDTITGFLADKKGQPFSKNTSKVDAAIKSLGGDSQYYLSGDAGEAGFRDYMATVDQALMYKFNQISKAEWWRVFRDRPQTGLLQTAHSAVPVSRDGNIISDIKQLIGPGGDIDLSKIRGFRTYATTGEEIGGEVSLLELKNLLDGKADPDNFYTKFFIAGAVENARKSGR